MYAGVWFLMIILMSLRRNNKQTNRCRPYLSTLTRPRLRTSTQHCTQCPKKTLIRWLPKLWIRMPASANWESCTARRACTPLLPTARSHPLFSPISKFLTVVLTICMKELLELHIPTSQHPNTERTLRQIIQPCVRTLDSTRVCTTALIPRPRLFVSV